MLLLFAFSFLFSVVFFVVWDKAISQFEIGWGIEHCLTVSSVSFLYDEMVNAPDRYLTKLPITFFPRTHCDCSIGGVGCGP